MKNSTSKYLVCKWWISMTTVDESRGCNTSSMHVAEIVPVSTWIWTSDFKIHNYLSMYGIPYSSTWITGMQVGTFVAMIIRRPGRRFRWVLVVSSSRPKISNLPVAYSWYDVHAIQTSKCIYNKPDDNALEYTCRNADIPCDSDSQNYHVVPKLER